MIDNTQKFEELMMNHLSENISDSDELLLLHILNSDPKFKDLYNEVVKARAIYQIPLIESKKASNYKLLLMLLNNGGILNRQSNFIHSFLKIAASIIFILSASVSTYYIFKGNNDFSNNLMVYETVVPQGSQTKIILPDKTVVWLNSGSKLRYSSSYGEKDRSVYLTGEGYFDVQKNQKKPFLVYANNIKVKVLGTVFNVRSYTTEPSVEVNLLVGKVDISLKKGNISKKLSLCPNEKMVYNKANNTIISYKVDASRSVMWITGKLSFVDASLEDIIKELERKYDIQIKIEIQSKKKELFSGSLDLNQPIEKILEYIDVDKKYTRTFNGKIITITDKN